MTTVLNPRFVRNEPDEFQRHPRRRMTEEEFVAWIGEKTRAEWVDGKVVMMAPVSILHDDLGWRLRTIVQLFAERHKLGTVYGSEVMIRLPKQRRRRMPDVSFVASGRQEIVHPNHIDGPPDLVMEVVSPDSIARDWREKYDDYQAAGVREYWIIDPSSSRVEAYALSRGRKFRRIIEDEDGIHSVVLPGFRFESRWVFATPLPTIFEISKELGIQ